MNLKQLLQTMARGFMQALGWRAANMMPVWLVIGILIVAIIFGVDW